MLGIKALAKLQYIIREEYKTANEEDKPVLEEIYNDIINDLIAHGLEPSTNL